jgi:hypothetical protein
MLRRLEVLVSCRDAQEIINQASHNVEEGTIMDIELLPCCMMVLEVGGSKVSTYLAGCVRQNLEANPL